MAKDNNLQDFLIDIADAIREKKGTTDKINPQNFSNEISSLKVGDSSTIEYLDVRNLSDEIYEIVLLLAIMAKKERSIAPAMYAMALGSDTGKASAVGIDLNLKCSIDDVGEITVRGIMELTGIIEIVDAIPRITKEEFYSLE